MDSSSASGSASSDTTAASLASGTSTSDSGDTDSSSPLRKRKKYACVFHKQYSKTFPWATDSKKGPTFAFCMRCNRDISLGQGGTKDLRRHEQTTLHSRSEKACVGAAPLQSYFGPIRETSVVEAEVKFGFFLGEHHLAFQLADHCTRLFRSMFPDSAIAKNFKCSRTKATAVLKVVAQDVWRHIAVALKESKYFSLQTDETTDISVTQQAAIMLRFFDNTLGRVRCVFFTLESVERATAELLFEAIDRHFQGSDVLSYEALVGLGTDGANVMMGLHNSVMSRLRSKQPGLIAMHCNCHIAALIANSACKVLPAEVEELTTDVWYYFQKSPKRKREFEQFQCFVDTKPHKLLKACQTRWLSLEACVNRLIEQYDALLSYFRSTEDRLAVVRRVKLVLEKPTTKAYLLFLSFALPIINNFNKCMQQQAPIVHVLNQELDGFVRRLMLRFIQADLVLASSSVAEVCTDDTTHYLPLSEVHVGQKTSQYFEEEEGMSTTDVNNVRKTIVTWWHAAAKAALKRLPLVHPLLINLQWLQPGLQQYSLACQVVAAADCLPQVVGVEDRPHLQEEFMHYCTSPLPLDVKALTEVDEFWHAVGNVQDLAGTGSRYPTLARLAKAILVIPHGNADTERVFSHLGLNKTKHRNSLGISTLNSLLTVQFNTPQKCHEFKPSADLIRRCKNVIAEVHKSTESE